LRWKKAYASRFVKVVVPLVLVLWLKLLLKVLQANSSIGRVSVSKTEGWGFETLLACQK